MRLLFAIFILSISQLLANNVAIENLNTKTSTHFEFEVSWENSWRNDTGNLKNYDALWIFAKYQEDGEDWKHLKISPVSSKHQVQNSDLELQAESDSAGFFIYPKLNGIFPFQRTELKIEQAKNIDLEKVNLKVFAIEMAYIPQGGYFLGDSLSNFSFKNASDLSALWIDSEDPIYKGNAANQLCDTCSYTESIPANFPKGTEAFYCMKYEISQAQYAAFLNTLNFTQQQNRIGKDLNFLEIGNTIVPTPKRYRNGLVLEAKTEGKHAKFACDLNTNNAVNSADDGGNISCNFLNEEDLKAYLDWAALRPMTELEYEKICRGPANYNPKEYAWGNTLVSNANNLIQAGTAEEYSSDTIENNHGFANHLYPIQSGAYYIEGPIRCGFAANAQSDRKSAGAAFYGVMEMSGNLWEQCVRAFGEGLSFEAKCGDGELDANGNSNVQGWRNAKSDLLIFRGGSWLSLVYNNLNYEFRDLAISDRFYANLKSTNRDNSKGGRGVR